MKQYTILYNPLSGSGTGKKSAETLKQKLDGQSCMLDITSIVSMKSFFQTLSDDETVIISGGDGTLSRFARETDGLEIRQKLMYYACGTGNDFWKDLGLKVGDMPIEVYSYIKDLPEVEINGVRRRFLNGIGYGIDGYCCEVGDRLREKEKKINYTAIAVKGLLFHYKPRNCTVTVDGHTYTYHRVWLAPTMHGRFYGGGMMPSPAQDRLSADGKESVMLMYGAGKAKTLCVFPSIFTGEHIKNKKIVDVISGDRITVCFDRPTPLQIDGETVTDVTEYTVISRAAVALERRQLAAV